MGSAAVHKELSRIDKLHASEAKMQGEAMQSFQKLVNGDFAVLEDGKEIIGSRFHQFLVSQSVNPLSAAAQKTADISLQVAITASPVARSIKPPKPGPGALITT